LKIVEEAPAPSEADSHPEAATKEPDTYVHDPSSKNLCGIRRNCYERACGD